MKVEGELCGIVHAVFLAICVRVRACVCVLCDKLKRQIITVTVLHSKDMHWRLIAYLLAMRSDQVQSLH